MDAETIFAILFGLVVGVFSIIVAGEIGRSKGRPDGWGWGLLGPIGVMYLYMLPGRAAAAELSVGSVVNRSGEDHRPYPARTQSPPSAAGADAFQTVAATLFSVQLERHLPKFRAQGIDDSLLHALDDDALMEMGITAQMDRARILSAVASRARAGRG